MTVQMSEYIKLQSPVEGEEFGSFELFFDDDGQYGAGWYWWPCWPGCMPDGEVSGPFETKYEAIEDLQAF